MLSNVKTKHIFGFGSLVALAVVVACGGNNTGVQYGLDGEVVGDASPDSSGIIIIDSGHHTTTSSGGNSSSTIYTQPDTGTGTPDTGYVGNPDTSTPTPDTGTPTCSAACTADSDCTKSCGTASSGTSNCCDTALGQCFVSQTATCPVPVADGGHHHDGSTPPADTGSDAY
jgi:hypothetical protein